VPEHVLRQTRDHPPIPADHVIFLATVGRIGPVDPDNRRTQAETVPATVAVG
jgi:hypothetical protein